MNTALNLVDPLDSLLAQRAREDALITEALQLLDQRHFQRGEVLITPADAAAYLKLQLAPTTTRCLPCSAWTRDTVC